MKTAPTKKERILKNIKEDKTISKHSKGFLFASPEDVYIDSLRYLKAIEQGRIINNIAKVSSSGMSRTIKFLECSKNKNNSYRYLNFHLLFKCFGFTQARNRENGFTISGCGMDMIFSTNYNIIHSLFRLGFISKSKCRKLSQMTPTTI